MSLILPQTKCDSIPPKDAGGYSFLAEAFAATIWLCSRIFSGWTKSIVMQISFVMLIFLLFSDQISRGRSLRGGQTASVGRPLPSSPRGRKPDNFSLIAPMALTFKFF